MGRQSWVQSPCLHYKHQFLNLKKKSVERANPVLMSPAMQK